tara:strand:- start:169 stop:537 length:369 start_codon:yes stop_codon:yes gene_type:complete
MKNISTYIVCKEHIEEVKEFLKDFFEEEKGRYNHPEWLTFKLPKTDFEVNLIGGKDMKMTQNITFEINCESMEELEKYSKKYGKKIENFLATATGKPYQFYYIEIPGPQSICKVDISYCKDE